MPVDDDPALLARLDPRAVLQSGGSGLLDGTDELRPEPAGPLRFYVGHPKGEPPHYDFAANLPQVVEPPPARAELGPQRENPDYEPEPKPWTERWPWLVYVVLGAACLALLAMLGVLARTAVIRHDRALPASSV